MTTKLEYIDNVFVRTNNYKEMVEFYTQNFDLPIIYATDCVTRLQVGSDIARSMLVIIDEKHVVGDKLSYVGFNVRNIEESFKSIEQQKMSADTHIRTFGDREQFRYFNVKDPDGNILTLVEPR